MLENNTDVMIFRSHQPMVMYRPFVLDAEEQKGANFETLKAVGKQFDGMTFRIQVDVLDCLGCGNCCLLYTSR